MRFPMLPSLDALLMPGVRPVHRLAELGRYTGQGAVTFTC